MHEFNAGEHAVDGAERFEVEHRPGNPFDGAMVLFDDVVEVFDLAHQDLHVAASVDRIDRRHVGAALVHRDLFRIAVRSHGVVEEALRRSHIAFGREQEVDGLSLLIDGAVQVFPDAFDLNVGLIHAPAATDWALVALFHYLFQVSLAQRVSYILADANEDHVDRI